MDKTKSIVASTTTANLINVLGFIFFYIAKYFNDKTSIAIVAFLFLCNSFFIIQIIYRIQISKTQITDIKKNIKIYYSGYCLVFFS